MAGEVVKMQTFDGHELYLNGFMESVRFLVAGGFAMPPVNFTTFRGYRQVGSTLQAPVAAPRPVTVDMWVQPKASRAQYWEARRAVEDFFRVNRGGPLTLFVILPNGDHRCIDVRGDPGPIFPAIDPSSDIWQIRESLQFIAHDPIWYNDVPQEFTPAVGAGSSLIFPITFPIVFGPGLAYFDTGLIDYAGTFDAWMWMKLTGPYTWVKILNTETGALIELVQPIAEGEIRYIDLRNQVAIFDGDNVSRFSDLGIDTDLVQFPIRPGSAAPARITAEFHLGSAASQFYLAVYERFMGI